MVRRVRGMCWAFNATCALLSGLLDASAAIYSCNCEVDGALDCIARRWQPYARTCHLFGGRIFSLPTIEHLTASHNLGLACPVRTRREEHSTRKNIAMIWPATSSPLYPTRAAITASTLLVSSSRLSCDAGHDVEMSSCIWATVGDPSRRPETP